MAAGFQGFPVLLSDPRQLEAHTPYGLNLDIAVNAAEFFPQIINMLLQGLLRAVRCLQADAVQERISGQGISGIHHQQP